MIEYIRKMPANIMESFHLHRSQPEDWTDALYWLLSTFISGLMPVWLPWLLLIIFSQQPSLSDFTHNGEFALISASLVSASYYIVTKESRWNFLRSLHQDEPDISMDIRSFPQQRLLGYVSWIITILCALIFAGVLFARFPNVNIELNSIFIHNISLILFGSTLFISFLITVVDNAFARPIDIFEARKDDLAGLRDRLKSLQGDDHNG